MQFNKAQLSAVLSAACTDAGRYNLNGVHFEAERMVATDGNRLHIVDGDITPLDAPVTLSYESCKRIIKAMGPKDTAQIVKASELDGTAMVEVSSGVELACELIVGQFCDYKQVVPEKSDTKKRVIVNARYLRDLCDAAIKAEGMSKNGSNAIMLEMPDDELSPIRVDSQEGFMFTAVLMPQRA